jgi:LmbE family N-acetylglucosaminyl deacetylase
MHLFLSPHADDVVLSCGGTLYQLTRRGESVEVITLMLGDVPPDMPASPFIQEHIIRWKLGPNPVPGRKHEDQQAVQLLGGEVHFGSFPDALYRTDGNGTALYPNLAALFGDINPRDPVLSQMSGVFGRDAVIYAPLGVGHHVDHQIVRNAVVNWKKRHPEVAVFFYEEYPYSANGDEVVQAARDTLGLPVIPIIQSLSQNALDAKVKATACYQSQISTFWNNTAVMAEAVRSYTERFWQPVEI